jgi:hypothetical protein
MIRRTLNSSPFTMVIHFDIGIVRSSSSSFVHKKIIILFSRDLISASNSLNYLKDNENHRVSFLAEGLLNCSAACQEKITIMVTKDPSLLFDR